MISNLLPNIPFIKKHFFKLINILEGISTYVDKLNLVTKNFRLLSAANSSTVPKQFVPFIRMMEEAEGRKIKGDYTFTKDDLIESDELSSKQYSVLDLNFKQLKLDYVFLAALATAEELGMLKMNPTIYTPAEAADSFRNNTSSSYPLFMKKREQAARDEAIQWTEKNLVNPKISEFLKQYTACFHRFQFKIDNENNPVKKIRQVWALPFNILTFEAVMLRGLYLDCINYVRNTGNIVAPWGLSLPQISDKIITRFRRIQNETGCDLISLDVKAFDQTVPTWMFALFFSCLFLVYSPIYYPALIAIMAYECFTPYCMRSNRIRFQKRGIPSGSLLTQLLGTFVTRFIINYAFLESTKGKVVVGEFANGLGDDNIIALCGITYSHIVSVYKRCGLELSLAKTKVSKPGKPFDYLGYTWDEENRPTKDIKWYIARFSVPSKYVFDISVTYAEYQTFRCLSLSMTLYNGLNIFEYLIGRRDKVYRKMLEDYDRGITVQVPLMDDRGFVSNNTVPLHQVKTFGWRYFGGDEFNLDLTE